MVERTLQKRRMFIILEAHILLAVNHGNGALAFSMLGSHGWSLWSPFVLVSFSPLVIQGHQSYLLLTAITVK